MKIFSSLFRLSLSGMLMLALATSAPLLAQEGSGKQKADEAVQKSQILMLVGVATVAWGIAEIAAQNYAKGALIMGMGIAEIAGGAKAQGQNQIAAAQLGNGNAMASGSGAFGNLGPGLDPATLCGKGGTLCTCTNAECTGQTLTIPSADSIRDNMRLAYQVDNQAFGGKSLEQALSEFDKSYQEASEAIAAFNASGGLNPNASPSQTSTMGLVASEGDLQGLGKNHKAGDRLEGIGLAGERMAGSGSTDAPGGKAGLGVLASTRSPRRAVNRHGLTLEDAKSGRLLTIFERVTRAIRSDWDRDLVLARMEVTRKSLAKKNQLAGEKDKSVATLYSDPK